MLTFKDISHRKLHFIVMISLLLASAIASLLIYKSLESQCTNNTIVLFFCICCAVITILLPATYYLLFVRQAKLESSVLMVVSVLSLISSIACPPGMIPDETAHIQTAYRYSNVMMSLPFSSGDDGIYRRSGDEEIYALPVCPGEDDYAVICDDLQLFSDHDEENVIYDTTYTENNETGFITYLPSALGITIARLLNLDVYPMLYLGRIFNLLFYSVCLYLAIKITPLGKYIFASIAVLPMVIHLVCSFSGDMPVMGLSFLYTAYLLRMIYGDDPISKKDMAICCILIFLIVPCKFIFFFLILLPLLVPTGRFNNKKNKRLFVLFIALSALLSVFTTSLPVILKYINSAEQAEAALVNGIYETYSVGWVLDHPIETARCFFETIFYYGRTYVYTILGGALGHLEININSIAAYLLTVCMLLSALLGNESDKKIPYYHRVPYVFIFGAAFLLSMMAMLVSWTPVGSAYIEGVQGRYFLPVLPLMLLAFSGVRVCAGGIIRKSIIMLETLIDVYTLVLIFLTIMGR